VSTRAGEGHGFDDDAVGGTTQTAQVGLQLEAPRPKVQVTPAGRDRPGVIAPAGLVLAVGAEQAPAPERHGDHHHRGQELHGGDIDVVESQRALECGRIAFAAGFYLIIGAIIVVGLVVDVSSWVVAVAGFVPLVTFSLWFAHRSASRAQASASSPPGE